MLESVPVLVRVQEQVSVLVSVLVLVPVSVKAAFVLWESYSLV